MAVKEKLTKLRLHFVFVNMSVVDVMENITNEQQEQVKIDLVKSGLELMDDCYAIFIEKIKDYL